MGDAKKLADAMRKTLNLPHTAFPMRANAVVRERELHARCVTQVYEAQTQLRQDADVFVLHDGPPFANGSLHMGHFMNKVIKDIINRYKLMRGHRIQYVPGWDCHGLPIEIKALEKLKSDTDRSDLTPSQVRKLSRELALGAVQDQKQDFERWGVLADWSGKPGSYYVTMDPAYEAKQYNVLKKMVADGLIFRGFKPVYWSPSSQTALAESELEYQDNHVSHAAYIRFAFHDTAHADAKALLAKYDNLSAVIWTTTPWTIPANMALCVNANLEYAIVRHEATGAHYLVAKDLVDSFAQTLSSGSEEESELIVLDTVLGSVLQGSLFTHPLIPERKSVVLVGDHVTTDAGTGVVHTAPGHGQDDYFAWMAHHNGSVESMAFPCPIDAKGHFTSEAGAQLEGLDILSDGTKAVLELLTESGHLLHVRKYKHRYPYDWRTKKPVVLRATAQWFAKLDKLHEVGKQVLAEEVEMFPKTSRRRLEATLSSRNEWCISRQRAWGLPIPVFYHKDTDEPLINEETISHLQEIVRTYNAGDGRQGSDCWWDLSVQELLPPSYAARAHEYVKGMDTLDVWFDSGSSWHAVLDENPSGPTRADVYMEGSDQHRGWFQSSLLTSLAMQQTAPYKHVITHGFALDERGSKMSKSLGNTLVPKDFIEGSTMNVPSGKKIKQIKVPGYGADVLRYWVATTDYNGDVSVGPTVIGKVSDALRKVRNTARFLLANLNDFQPHKHAVKYEQLTSVDKYMLHLLFQLKSSVTEGYDVYAFNRVQHAISHFISTDLSAFYMEACKDRLYCDGQDATSRRSAQTVLWLTLQSLSRAIAPVVCHTAEDIRLHFEAQVQQCDLEDVVGSIFTEQDAWLPSAPEWENAHLADDWNAIRQLRFEVNRIVEKMRAENRVGSQLECNVYVVSSHPRVQELLVPLLPGQALENVLLCSGAQVVASESEIDAQLLANGFRSDSCHVLLGDEKLSLELVVTSAKGHKCPRCWKYAPEVDANETHLCVRCQGATSLKSVEDLARSLVQE
uniref:isoleucine--tRNA ligase n=1 Tax=Globisporangium ultimum (strain ATCC 200006 / CBS 805.95 / DAOM BR144) TaxID=431595 RepID=K3XAI7_GLOUD